MVSQSYLCYKQTHSVSASNPLSVSDTELCGSYFMPQTMSHCSTSSCFPAWTREQTNQFLLCLNLKQASVKANQRSQSKGSDASERFTCLVSNCMLLHKSNIYCCCWQETNRDLGQVVQTGEWLSGPIRSRHRVVLWTLVWVCVSCLTSARVCDTHLFQVESDPLCTLPQCGSHDVIIMVIS